MQTTRHKKQLRQWTEMVSTQFHTLSKPEASVLALWSFAAVVLQTASLSLVSLFLACLLDQKPNTLRQRLREFYKPGSKKKGKKRRQIDVQTCFTPLFRWVLELWPQKQIAIALDPTLCRNRFAALAVSLVYPGGSIPLAWKILPANKEAAWMPHWKPLLEQLQQALPPGYRVLVLCDRGLYKKELFDEICAIGFHPVMRLTKNGLFNPESSTQWIALSKILPEPGYYYQGKGEMFKTQSCRLKCTLVALWEPGYDEPWYLITNLASLDGAYYGLRTWIEQGFRCIKSSGCKWEQSRMLDCERIERLWLVYALSLLWTQALAGEIESGEATWISIPLTELFDKDERRRIRRYRLGFLSLLLALIKGKTLPLPKALYPDPWPVSSNLTRIKLFKEQLC